MATNATYTRLQNQRSQSSKIYSIARSGRRVMPLSGYSDRLAGQAQSAIDDDYERRFEDGLVSYEDYVEHLDKMLKRGGLTPSEISKVSDRMRDVQRISQAEALESTYAQTQPGTPERVSAAASLAAFYEDMAGKVSPNTPAYANAVANAAQWNNAAAVEGQRIEKNQRVSLRYAELARVSSLPSDDPDSVVAKAQVYARLRDEAMADGEIDEANRYEASFQKSVQDAEVAQQKQVKTGIVDYFNNARNEYEDGKIGPYEYMQAITAAEQAADEIGDYGLSLRINALRESAEKDIERAGKAGASSFKKTANENLDTIELDLSRLENSFKFGQPFEPQSEFFKQFIKENGTPDLQDFVALKALAFGAALDIVDQMEEAGIDVAESRRATLEEKFTESEQNRNTFAQGRLIAVVDPGTGEVELEDLDSPEEANKFYTDPSTGLSFALIDKNTGENKATFEQQQYALSNGFASPRFFAQSGNLTNSPDAPFELWRKRTGLLGIDQLNPDVKIDTNVPIYETGEKDVYAVRASDIGEGDDPDLFLRVEVEEVGGTNRLNIKNDQVVPAYDIDPVIVVPNADGGLDRVYLKKDPVTGKVNKYYSEARGELNPNDLPGILRGTGAVSPGVQAIRDTVGSGYDFTGAVEPKSMDSEVVSAKEPFRPEAVDAADMSKFSTGSTNMDFSGIDLQDRYPQPKLHVPVPKFLQPSAAEIQQGLNLKGSQYDENIIAGKKASQILAPQTFSDKLVSGGLRYGAKVQEGIQNAFSAKNPIIQGLGNLFRR